MTSKELKATRKKLTLSQTALAQKLGVSLRTYQYWEAGESRIPAMIVPALNAIEQRLSFRKGGG